MSENGSITPAASAGRARSIEVARLLGLAGLAAIGVVLSVEVARTGSAEQHWWLVAFLVVGLVDAVVGTALLTRFGHRRLAWCLLIGGAAAVAVVVLATASSGYAATIRRAAGWHGASDIDSWARPLATGVLVALVPWELAVRGRRRGFEVMWWTTAALVAATVVGEAAGAQSPGIDVVDIATWLVAGSATVATMLLVTTWWRSRGNSDDPLQGWLAAGSVVAWLAVVPERINIDGWGFRGSDVVGPLLLIATLPLLVVGVIVRAMRERAGRFQGVAHDVIGWLVLSAAIIAVYTGVVAGLGRFLGGNGSTWLLIATTGIIAIFVEPARHWVRGTVDRLVWGARDDPLEVVRGVVDHVGADSDGELLPALVTSLQRELRLDAVAIDVRIPDGWRRVAATGPITTYQRVVELEQRDQVVGRLIVGWEHGPYLRKRDEHILAELAGPVGLAVGWVRLATELRQSSVAIASTREEERRRLRRDLHDGLGPGLTGVSLGLRTALRQLDRATDPAIGTATLQLLTRAADEVDALVIEVKRIVRDLRPTALDQLGLVDAVGEFTRTISDDLEFHLAMPNPRIELPAVVEVAIYRIVTEAVTNVVRHARAAHCWLTISTGSNVDVDIDVVDDGVGVVDGGPVGVGWTAMRERATELGGSVQITPRQPHGTHIHVRLPVMQT